MRIVKEADVRKNEIVDAAAILFAEKGFDRTTTNDILEAVGIAKGTLYHHFKSKEEIMDALIDRQTGSILTMAQAVADDRSIPVEERMVRTIMALRLENTDQAGGRELIEHLHKPQNALMHQKTRQIILQRVPPMMAGILKDGVEMGMFQTPYPLECMEMVVCYLNTMMDDDVFELTPEQAAVKARAFMYHLERLLGVEEGQIAYFREALFGKEGMI